MENLIIRGGTPLRGTVLPSANKNAVLPVLCSTLLAQSTVTLRNVPDITDVHKIVKFYLLIGSKISFDPASGVLVVDHSSADYNPKIHTLPEGMRSSIMLIPPLLHRFRTVRLEGDVKGCSLGSREIDPHIELFKRFGVSLTSNEDALELSIADRFHAADHWLEYASVTTTENFVLASSCAIGNSVLINAACEPHVQEFCSFIQLMGAKIEGVGTSTLKIAGVSELGGCEFEFEEDFHEVATFLALGAITYGDVAVKNSSSRHFPLIDKTFAKFNVEISHKDGWSRSHVNGKLKAARPFTQHILPKVEAAPWPYVPADLLPIFVALGVRAEGEMMFWNKVYDGALGWTSELSKFGAHAVLCDPHRVIVFGGKDISPATVEAPYIIRVAIALLMLAASIDGKSVIHKAAPIRRAHPHFTENLIELGASVEWN